MHQLFIYFFFINYLLFLGALDNELIYSKRDGLAFSRGVYRSIFVQTIPKTESLGFCVFTTHGFFNFGFGFLI